MKIEKQQTNKEIEAIVERLKDQAKKHPMRYMSGEFADEYNKGYKQALSDIIASPIIEGNCRSQKVRNTKKLILTPNQNNSDKD